MTYFFDYAMLCEMDEKLNYPLPQESDIQITKN